jgi:LPXTG-motif cell wall-anchored protein
MILSKKIASAGAGLVLAMTIIASGAGAGPAVALDSTWSPTVDISAIPGSADYAQVAVSATGLATAVWMNYDGTDYVIQTSTSQNGVDWTPIVPLSAAGGNAFNAHIAVDANGLATAIWVRDNGGSTTVQSRTSLNGAAWSPVVNLSVAATYTDWPQITVDAHNLVTAVWTRLDGTNIIVQARTSQDGAPWSPVVDLSATGGDADLPQIATNSNGLAVAIWTRVDGINYTVQTRTSLNGASWSPVTDLVPGGGYTNDPHVTVDARGRVTAVWTESDGTHSILQTRTSSEDAALPWSPVASLSLAGADALNPEVAVGPNGLRTAVWAHSDGSNSIVQSRTSPDGETWSPVVDLSAIGRDARFAHVTVNTNGLANAIWLRNDGSNDIVQTSTSLNGAAWSPVVDLSAAGHDAHYPQLTVGTNGLAIAIWASTSGRDKVVQIRTLQEEIPLPPVVEPASLANTGPDSSTSLAGALALILVMAGCGMLYRRHSMKTVR